MTDHLGAVVAFVALGANILAAGLHLLFNPYHRVARWFIAWSVVWIVVLCAQGMMLLPGSAAVWSSVFSSSAFMLPVVFLAFALVTMRGWTGAAALCLIGCWIGWMLLAGVGFSAASPWSEAVWYGTWICGMVVMWGCTRRELFPGRGGRLPRRLVMGALFLFLPVTLVAGVLGGNWYGLYIAPLSSIVLQFLVFLGVIHFRLYDTELTAVRGGDMATRAAETQRLAVVGELAASVAHEVRNPMTGVRSLAQRLADEGIDDDRRRQYAQVILNETQRVEDIVTSLLNLSRGTDAAEPAIASTDLTRLFSDLTLLLGRRAEERSVTIETDANDVVVEVAADALTQVLLNLVLNAIHHAREGGSVALAAHANGQGADITVDDDGPGIPPERRRQLFEPFHTESGGTGLGLAVVRRLAREHEWTVSAEDSPLGGARFRVALGS